jgi:nucleotide-binding universal stress UspA family protein
MMRSVLCPVDFSDGSRTALHVAGRFARQFKARLYVLFVEGRLRATAGALGATSSPDLREELKRFVAETPHLDLPVEPTLHVVTGHPAQEIVAFAEREQVDVIVMGTHGLTGFPKAFFGSTTARVLQRATTSLVAVPPMGNGSRDLAGLGSILVLTDFGPAAAHAATAAAQLSAIVGARLVLVHVVPAISLPASWSSRAELAAERREAEAHRCICEAMAPLEKYGPVESDIVRGNIAERVEEMVQTHHAGLIVMGLERDARGSRPGSTAYSVICRATVPVLTMPVAASNARTEARVDGAEFAQSQEAPAHAIA